MAGATLAPAGGAPPALQTGRSWPLGASVDDDGVNFAVFSRTRRRSSCACSTPPAALNSPACRCPAAAATSGTAACPVLRPGCCTACARTARGGLTAATASTRTSCCSTRGAREIVGTFNPDPAGPNYGAEVEHPQHMDLRDNGATALKARVVHDEYDWGDDQPPATPLADTVIYETHVRGFTKLLAAVPKANAAPTPAWPAMPRWRTSSGWASPR